MFPTQILRCTISIALIAMIGANAASDTYHAIPSGPTRSDGNRHIFAITFFLRYAENKGNAKMFADRAKVMHDGKAVSRNLRLPIEFTPTVLRKRKDGSYVLERALASVPKEKCRRTRLQWTPGLAGTAPVIRMPRTVTVERMCKSSGTHCF